MIKDKELQICYYRSDVVPVMLPFARFSEFLPGKYNGVGVFCVYQLLQSAAPLFYTVTYVLNTPTPLLEI